MKPTTSDTTEYKDILEAIRIKREKPTKSDVYTTIIESQVPKLTQEQKLEKMNNTRRIKNQDGLDTRDRGSNLTYFNRKQIIELAKSNGLKVTKNRKPLKKEEIEIKLIALGLIPKDKIRPLHLEGLQKYKVICDCSTPNPTIPLPIQDQEQN